MVCDAVCNSINAPERAQKYGAKGGTWACGKTASAQMLQITAGGPVQCAKVTQEVDVKVVATCHPGGINLCEVVAL